MRLAVAIASLLAAITIATYWRALDNDFIRAFDDVEYVLGNPHVQHGVTPAFIQWAFTSAYYSNWSPLTWISHAIDVQAFGLESARGHHAVNIALHALNAALLFLVLWNLTGAAWRSALVAGLFALHPTHVESVAWISERKDVLSTCFALLTMLAYIAFVRQRASGGGGPIRRTAMWCTVALACFALSLMAKQMFVTLPAVLLLLDIWPLRRVKADGVAVGANDEFGPATSLRTAITEKLPLVALALAASVIAVLAQHSGQSVRDLESVPLTARAATAIISYVEYLRMTLWPKGLAVFYPYHQPVPAMDVLLSLMTLGIISGVVWRLRGSKPYLLIGWLWYLGTLVPVIGLVQVGEQSHADRYTYFPTIGVFIAIVWLIGDRAQKAPSARIAAGAASVAALIALAACTVRQISHWRDAETLFAHALRVTSDNWLAHNNYGTMLLERGDTPGAMEHFRRALAIRPDYPLALTNAGDAALAMNRPEEAVSHFDKAAAAETLGLLSRVNFATALAMCGRLEEAETQITAARRLDATYPQALVLLGQVRMAQQRVDEAIDLFQMALQRDPNDAEAHFQVAQSLIAAGRAAEAFDHLREVLRITPDDAQALALLRTLSPPASQSSGN